MPQVRPQDYVVVVQRVHEDFCVKIVQVNETGKVRWGGWEGVCVLGGGEMGEQCRACTRTVRAP